MRFIIHAEHAEDAIMGARAVQAAVRNGKTDVIYAYGIPEEYSVYVKANKTGFTAYVTNSQAKEQG